jgi:hypothetical protein
MNDIPTYHRGSRNYGTGYDMMARIDELEAAIIDALRETDDNMRPILRKALHGEDWG